MELSKANQSHASERDELLEKFVPLLVRLSPAQLTAISAILLFDHPEECRPLSEACRRDAIAFLRKNARRVSDFCPDIEKAVAWVQMCK